MPTTVESSMAMPEPRTMAATTQRPRPLERARGSGAAPVGVTPPASPPVLIAGSSLGAVVHGEGDGGADGQADDGGDVGGIPVTARPVDPDSGARCNGQRHGSIMVPGALRCGWANGPYRYFRMLTARATTRIATTREMASSAIIMSFIQGLTADTSVGLKAVAVAKAKWK